MAAPAKVRPRLESGDRMTRFEFHRRYEAHLEINCAQLIEGVVYIGGRVPASHGGAHALTIGWLGWYAAKHRQLEVSDSATVILDSDNEVQPDACLRPIEGGTSRIDSRGYIEGPPELVVEIAASSVSIDLHDKMDAYRRGGVREYIVWRVDDGAVDWFRLEDGAYLRVEPGADSVIEGNQFPGLRLNTAALLASDAEGVATALS